MLTCQWQRLGPELGAGVPAEVTDAGAGDIYRRALDTSRAEFERLEAAGMVDAAPYALCLGYRIRYVLDLNAREAMHLWSFAQAAKAIRPTARSRRPCMSGSRRSILRSPPA